MARIEVNEVELHYEDSGEGDPIVLIHGSWSDHRTWDALVPALAGSHRVVAYDRRGHSLSERPATPGSRREDEDDLADLIEALELGPVHLVGNSWGASTALGLTARRPELVRSVAAHEPPLMALLAGDPEAAALAGAVEPAIERVVEQIVLGNLEDGARTFMEEVALGPGAWELLPLPLRKTAVFNAPTFVDDVGDPDWAEVDRELLAVLEVPVLLTQGDQSPAWFSPIVGALAGLIDHAEIHTLAGAGHAPQLTHAGDYGPVLLDFTARATKADARLAASR